KPLELLNVLRKIEKRGALEKMRKVRQRCSEVFRYAIATGRAEYNPAADLSSALEVHQSNHFPFLKADEIPDFLRALEGYSGSKLVQIATKLLMITGVRTIELRAALWQEFDLDNAIWEIPAERMKMRRPHLVPLSSQAVDLLNELKIMTGNYRYVFPGRNDPNRPMSEASINQAIKRIGYGGKVTGHGFRHTLSTILHEQGFESAWIEIQLAHVDKNSIRGTYNHAQYFSGRKSMMDWYSNLIFERLKRS
ncbi:site-specific integrase, partial [Escherichia coli]|nr:site-specific integrase [Escherichia coli]